MWESLALGTIPVTLRDTLAPMYQHLPVLILDDMTDLTEERLAAFYKEAIEREKKGEYQWIRVTAFYWLQHIVMDARRKAEVLEEAMGSAYARRLR
jgi:hypothetical protein